MRTIEMNEICLVSGGTVYCGPSGSALSSLIPDVVAGSDFSNACKEHDREFAPGSGVSMLQANRNFLNNMLAAAEGNPVAQGAAFVYFGFVSAFGSFFYQGDQPAKTGRVEVIFYGSEPQSGGGSDSDSETTTGDSPAASTADELWNSLIPQRPRLVEPINFEGACVV